MRKQGSSNDRWVELYKGCTEEISRQEIELLTRKAIKDLKNVVLRYGFKNIGYAWSGGKDSIVLYDILEKSGIVINSGLCVVLENEYPEFEEWLYKNAPKNVRFMKSNVMNLEWYNDNENMLFPVDSKDKAKYTQVWRKEEFKFFKDEKLDVLICGRRTEDGNFCRKNQYGDYLNVNKQGIVELNLIAEWNHAQLLAYIRYNKLEIPPIYNYPNGWVFGTHPWTERDRVNGSVFDTFAEIEGIDNRILEEARGKLKLVDKYFDFKAKGGEKI